MRSDFIPSALALNRFGVGARPGDLARVGRDPQGFFLTEIRSEQPQTNQILPETPTILADLREESRRVDLARARNAATGDEPRPEGIVLSRLIDKAEASGKPMPAPAQPRNDIPQAMYQADIMARVNAALTTDGGFVERLVWFWSNHFAVGVSKGNQVQSTAGAFEREAIRPFVLGRFSDMLHAVETHPTMIYYLDNNQSIGPSTETARRQKKGLNENLAREILELHTLGVSGGYTQSDVTSLARVITGWTVAGPEGRLGRPGSTVFNVGLHEPGEQQVLGRYYPDFGPDQARDVFVALASEPATARHLATKLARHFVADHPPDALVRRLESTFRDTGGDLAAVAAALLQADESWAPEASKIRSPQEFVMGSLRLLGSVPENGGVVNNLLNALGQKMWDPPGPNGYPDSRDHWESPEGLKTRLDVAVRLSQRASDRDPMALLDGGLGDYASRETRQAVARAESRQQGVALLLMSPEFQRR
ncbi:DUF1800 domain-containing protein [Microvirga antarctica]|uniref:DUF1800 domain-containing protein n=1 Tax=Microvirga antarctica TaxID=2819233 RepID=UPI001FE2B7A2|nr:DUF1800 family protein [Microvirga antarctica]